MKKTPLRKKSKSDVAKCKDRIQDLVREIVILRDGGCILKDAWNTAPCSGFAQDGHLILQADHLVSRVRSISYGDTRLIVCVCKGHHGGYKKWHKERYDAMIKQRISPQRVKLWERIEADTKAYPMNLSDWLKVEIALVHELGILKKNTDV